MVQKQKHDSIFFFPSFLCVFAVRHQTMSSTVSHHTVRLRVNSHTSSARIRDNTAEQTPQGLLVKVSIHMVPTLVRSNWPLAHVPRFPLHTLNYSDALDDINIFPPLGCLSGGCFPIGTLMTAVLIFHSGAIYDRPPRTSRPRGCVQAPQRGDVTVMGGCVNH